LVKNNEAPTVDGLSKELEEINEHNNHCDEVAKLEESQKKIDNKKAESEGKTSRISEIDQKKKSLFIENPLPVKNLEFTEDEVLYKGLPFNEDQHSTAVLIGVGLKISMALNPNLKLLIIKDGSLLDGKMLKFILTMCDKKGYQVIIERVREEGEELEINFKESEI